MYTVRWCDREGNQQERYYDRQKDANAEARSLRKLDPEVVVTVEEDKRGKPPKMPAFLREALETGRTVKVVYNDDSQATGVIIDVDTNLRAITLGRTDGVEWLVFMSAISTII